jgi:hypothetical protein
MAEVSKKVPEADVALVRMADGVTPKVAEIL